MQCIQSLAPIAADAAPLDPLREGDCGAPAPVLLKSIGSVNKVLFDPPVALDCAMVVALDRWLRDSVQPAAREAFSSSVSQIIVPQKANTKDQTTEVTKVSTAAASVPASPSTASAKDLGASAEAKFLRLAHDGGCKIFSTVLGPEANDPHRNHLHLDLQERKTSVCK